MTELTANERWTAALESALKPHKKWCDDGDKIVKRYRDERADLDKGKRYNILWSNVQTMKPAVYAQAPKPRVSRRYKDQDPIARDAARVLERVLVFSIDSYDFDEVMESSIEDYLLPGRGVAKVRYKPSYTPMMEEGQPVLDDEGNAVNEVVYEEAVCEYHFWKDFLLGPGRRWKELPWVAYRYKPDKKEAEAEYGKDIANSIQYALKEDKDENKSEDRAEIWEIWSKRDGEVIDFAWADKKIIRTREPGMNLHGFFPTPRPLFSLVTNNKTTPIPDYHQYKDQAEELDELTLRIELLVKALRVAGVYSAEHKDDMSRITVTGHENELIPVDSWAAIAEKGGMRGIIEWFPIEQIVTVVTGLYEAREKTKQELYEITGLSDIIRGASVASETATAQRIKGQFASLRLQDRQKKVAKYSRDLLRLKAEIVCEFFSKETLQMMTGIEFKDEQRWDQVIDLFRNDPLRTFKIDIETDSTVEVDEQADKESRIEFTRAMTEFLNTAGPMVQQNGELAPLMTQMMLFVVRGFRAGRELEETFEETAEQIAPEDPTPEQEAEQQKQEARMEEERQLVIRERNAEAAAKEAKAAVDMVEARERQAQIPLSTEKIKAEIRDLKATTDKTIAETENERDPVARELKRGKELADLQNSAGKPN